MMEHLSLLIKPASSLCNLRCKYCFYHSLSETRDNPSYGFMKPQTAVSIIEKAFAYAHRSVTFMFQGGEPTLAGLDFFKFFVHKAGEMNTKGLKLYYTIQTNGISVDEEFVKFFKKHDFLVGLSLDGTRDINDYLRIDACGRGTHKEILRTARIFDDYQINYNILTVVSAYTAKHIEKIYGYYKKNNFYYLQFIPCLDPLDRAPFSSPYSLTPHRYEEFLKTLFRLWYDDLIRGRYVSIRFFDNLIRMAKGERTEQCGVSGYCGMQFVFEADGTVFPCDFYCIDRWKVGNINEMSFENIAGAENMMRFIETSLEKDKKCKTC
ncbi:MAG: radical SAM protein, partial [Eubacteriales bacterium]|nr:radical SAM protein [Eubacteriales bacterium]